MFEWRGTVGNKFSLAPKSIVLETLEPGVYDLQWNADTNSFYLLKQRDSFELPEKIYDFDESFICRVCRTWEFTKDNLGVLLEGAKGSGKSITAKVICNRLKIPVVTISRKFQGFASFITSIPQDIVVMIDEFEKIFRSDEDQVPFLSLMDGVSGATHKRLYLLTTNTQSLNDNFLNRPGRIRYLKRYANLTKEQVMLILNDRLKKNYKTETLAYITQLRIITVDIVCKIVDEVNLFDEPPQIFGDIFNCSKLSEHYLVFWNGVFATKTDLTTKDVFFRDLEVGEHIGLKGINNATFKRVIDDETIELEDGGTLKFRRVQQINDIFE